MHAMLAKVFVSFFSLFWDVKRTDIKKQLKWDKGNHVTTFVRQRGCRAFRRKKRGSNPTGQEHWAYLHQKKWHCDVVDTAAQQNLKIAQTSQWMLGTIKTGDIIKEQMGSIKGQKKTHNIHTQNASIRLKKKRPQNSPLKTIS